MRKHLLKDLTGRTEQTAMCMLISVFELKPDVLVMPVKQALVPLQQQIYLSVNTKLRKSF
eukprot:7495502-Karenia_brevis.AAC.1